MAASTVRVYRRELPARGFVAIDVCSEHRLFRRRYHGTVVAERRSESRSPDDSPPAIAHAWGKTIDSVLEQLLPAAESDTAIAAALVRRQHSRVAEHSSASRREVSTTSTVGSQRGREGLR